MDVMFYLVSIAILLAMLFFVAEPYRVIPDGKPKKKRVGSTYWGIYEGTPIVEPDAMRTIEVEKSTRKEKYIAGSSTYAKGRGVKMSGHG